MPKASHVRRTSIATDSDTLRKLQTLATFERRPINAEIALLIDKRLKELGIEQPIMEVTA
jgi:hypothetical protein